MKSRLLILLLLLHPVIAQAGSVYTDDMGKVTYLENTPRRIVSLSPAITEILFALGLNKQVVGVTKFSNYPEEAKEKPQVGSYVSLNLERIISLKPDLVIATADGNRKEVVERLRKMGIGVFVINPHGFYDILASILKIGEISNRLEQAGKIVLQMSRRKEKVQALVADQKRVEVFVQIEQQPLVTVGKNTFWNNLIDLAGGKNIARDEPVRYPHYSMEEVVSKKPEVIILTRMLPQGDQAEMLNKWSKWKSIPAVKNNRIYTINPDLIDRPGPRIIEGLEELARLLHPEVFAE